MSHVPSTAGASAIPPQGQGESLSVNTENDMTSRTRSGRVYRSHQPWVTQEAVCQLHEDQTVVDFGESRGYNLDPPQLSPRPEAVLSTSPMERQLGLQQLLIKNNTY